MEEAMAELEQFIVEPHQGQLSWKGFVAQIQQHIACALTVPQSCMFRIRLLCLFSACHGSAMIVCATHMTPLYRKRVLMCLVGI